MMKLSITLKKSLMFIALALFAAGAHAENERVEFSVSTDNSTMTATMEMGIPTPFQQNHNAMSASCTFKHDFAGTALDDKYSVDVSSGMTTMVLPLERTATGVKAFITINKKSAQDQEWAVINKDCKLPVGKTSSAGISTVDTFKWGEPTKLKFSDGSVVVVTANKTRQAGIDFEKLSKAIESSEVSGPVR